MVTAFWDENGVILVNSLARGDNGELQPLFWNTEKWECSTSSSLSHKKNI
jgi:hypothetical protein